jgi:glycosyltransferase involved in cell wall biosynthesis
LYDHYRIVIVTSIHPDFDSRIWKHCTLLATSGYEVQLVCPWKVPDGTTIKNVQIHVFTRIKSRWLRPIQIPHRVFGKLLPLLRKADIIHFHDIDLLPWMALVSLFKPVVYDVHENYPEDMLERHWVPEIMRNFLYHGVRWFQYLLSRKIKNIVLVTEFQEKHFKPQNMNVLYLRNYASVDLLDNFQDDYLKREDVVIFTGSSYESNGLELIPEIAARIKNVYPQLKFLLADRFDNEILRSAFLDKIKNSGLENTIHLFPNKLPHDLMQILNQATIGIIPSLRVIIQENAIPTKLFEYMAAALPIVSSDLPYLASFFNRYKIGILAQPENPDTFTEAITKLVENRQWAYDLGKTGQHVFKEEYSWESQAQALMAYYTSIIGPIKINTRSNNE